MSMFFDAETSVVKLLLKMGCLLIVVTGGAVWMVHREPSSDPNAFENRVYRALKGPFPERKEDTEPDTEPDTGPDTEPQAAAVVSTYEFILHFFDLVSFVISSGWATHSTPTWYAYLKAYSQCRTKDNASPERHDA